MIDSKNMKSSEEIVSAIFKLDLGPIKYKLMDPEEGQGWSKDYVEKMEIAYKRFLVLLVKYPSAVIAPTKDIDKFWHGHILDTMKYAEDCEKIFGAFLHHFPYFGMRGETDAAELETAGKTLTRLYNAEFGESIPASTSFCWATVGSTKQSGAAFCWATVDSTKQSGASFCWAAVDGPARSGSAFCWAALESPKSVDASFCWAAITKRPDSETRPTI